MINVRSIALLFIAACCFLPLAGCTAQRIDIITCEQATNRWVLFDAKTNWNDAHAELWSWSAAACNDIPPDHKKWFIYPSGVKQLDNGLILVTASGGGVAIINTRHKQVYFHARAGANPHSAEMLPGGHIVVASSTDNRIVLFESRSRNGIAPPQDAPWHKQPKVYPLSSAHGVHWDHNHQCLWALGGKEIKQYTIHRQNSSEIDLIEAATIPLPVTKQSMTHDYHGGHDLSPVPGSDLLYVTDMDHIWLFDPEAKTFTPYEPLHTASGVKSISHINVKRPPIIMQASERWWSDTVRAVGEEKSWQRDGARFYKARWYRHK